MFQICLTSKSVRRRQRRLGARWGLVGIWGGEEEEEEEEEEEQQQQRLPYAKKGEVVEAGGWWWEGGWREGMQIKRQESARRAPRLTF